MRLRVLPALLALTLAAGGGLAQVSVHTETIRRPTTATPSNAFVRDGADEQPSGKIRPVAKGETPLDLAHLPAPVTRMRERILAAARSGDPQQVLALMQSGDTMPVFSHTQKLDPTAIWQEAYPDSAGLEALSTLVTILDIPFARFAPDTPQDTYVWPYFALMPLSALTPRQKIDLFRVITGSDYEAMLKTGRYAFYRVGIAPDGTWRYFVSGE